MIYGIAIGIIMIVWGIFGKYLPPGTAFMIMGPMIAVAAILGIISLRKNQPTTEKAEKTGKTTPKEPGEEDGKGKPIPPPPPPVQPADTPSGINWIKWLMIIAVLAGIVALFWHLSHVGTEIAMRQAAEAKAHPKPVKFKGTGGLDVYFDEEKGIVEINGKTFRGARLLKSRNEIIYNESGIYDFRFKIDLRSQRIIFHDCSLAQARQARRNAEEKLETSLGVSRKRLCEAISTGEFLFVDGMDSNVDHGFSICSRGRPF